MAQGLKHGEDTDFSTNLKNISDNIKAQISCLNSIQVTMQTNGWKGNNSTTFYKNMDDYKKNLDNLSAQIESYIEQSKALHTEIDNAFEGAAEGVM